MTSERQSLTTELIEAGRHVVAHGLVQASGGNLSVRLPDTDQFLVTGSGTWLDRLTNDDFAVLTTEFVQRAEGWCGGRLVSALEGGYAPERLGVACVTHMRALAGMDSFST